jgi:hypothetical protein
MDYDPRRRVHGLHPRVRSTNVNEGEDRGEERRERELSRSQAHD